MYKTHYQKLFGFLCEHWLLHIKIRENLPLQNTRKNANRASIVWAPKMFVCFFVFCFIHRYRSPFMYYWNVQVRKPTPFSFDSEKFIYNGEWNERLVYVTNIICMCVCLIYGLFYLHNVFFLLVFDAVVVLLVLLVFVGVAVPKPYTISFHFRNIWLFSCGTHIFSSIKSSILAINKMATYLEKNLRQYK